MEMFVEFKYGNTSDPFHTQDRVSFEKLHETTCAIRGQIAIYSTLLQTYQFRTWVFSIGIFGNVARLFRWDRAGAIVSEPIDYSTSQDLEEFLHRFDKMTPAQRGFDPTVKNATKVEAADFDKAINSAVTTGRAVLLKGLLASVGDKTKCPRRRVEITCGEEVEQYIVGRPIAGAKSPTGRATRGFVAMSKKDKKLVFLKDSWRPDIPGMMGEAHWFERLEGARNICAFQHGSDVGRVVVKRYGAKKGKKGKKPKKSNPPQVQVSFQRTLSNVHSKKEMIGYIHYRTIQSELYVPLHMFEDSKHLVQVMLDIAHGTSWLSSVTSIAQPPSAIEDLYARGILHRDISAANIMIAVNGCGHLIDLNLARDVNDRHARLSVRTVSSPQPQFILGFKPADLPALQGTWQFMSTRLLTVPANVHELCDDLESLWFVLLYEALHFVKHNDPPGIDMHSTFDQFVICPKTGAHTGGMGKRDLYASSSGQRVVMTIAFESQPFTTLIKDMYLLFKTLVKHYAEQDDAIMLQGGTVMEPVPKKLRNCEAIKTLFATALKSKGWKEGDKAEDQYPTKKNTTPGEKDVHARSYLPHLNSAFGQSLDSGEISGMKRKRGGDEDEGKGGSESKGGSGGESDGDPPDSPSPPKGKKPKIKSKKKPEING